MTIQNLTDEQRAFAEALRDFAQRECGTREQRDALTDHGSEPHNSELYARIAELGWLGVAIPEAYGGSGGGAVDMCLLCEGFAHGQIPMGFFSVSMITAGAVERFGSEELKTEILGGVASGRTTGGAGPSRTSKRLPMQAIIGSSASHTSRWGVPRG